VGHRCRGHNRWKGGLTFRRCVLHLRGRPGSVQRVSPVQGSGLLDRLLAAQGARWLNLKSGKSLRVASAQGSGREDGRAEVRLLPAAGGRSIKRSAACREGAEVNVGGWAGWRSVDACCKS